MSLDTLGFGMEDLTIAEMPAELEELAGLYNFSSVCDIPGVENITNISSICHPPPPPPLPTSFLSVIQIFYGLVCLLGLIGNTLVIYVVVRFSKMHTVTNMYILNLAFADECFLVGIPFLIVTMTMGRWPFGAIMCKIYYTTTSVNQITSSIFLTVLSADRYIAVCHPISSPKIRTPLAARMVSLSAWVTSILLMIPVFLYATTISRPDGNQSCNIFWHITTSDISSIYDDQVAFTYYSFVFGFACPLTFILVFYTLVIVKLRSVGPQGGVMSENKKRRHRKVTKLVLTVISVYVLCWLPHWATQLSLISQPPGHSGETFVFVTLLTDCLSYSNSAVNPILYAFLSENFKKSFVKACRCLPGQGSGVGANNDFTLTTRRGHRLTASPTGRLTALDDEEAGVRDISTAVSRTSRTVCSQISVGLDGAGRPLLDALGSNPLQSGCSGTTCATCGPPAEQTNYLTVDYKPKPVNS